MKHRTHAVHIGLHGLDFEEFGRIKYHGKDNDRGPVVVQVLVRDPGSVLEVAVVLQPHVPFEPDHTSDEIRGHHRHMGNGDQERRQLGEKLAGVLVHAPWHAPQTPTCQLYYNVTHYQTFKEPVKKMSHESDLKRLRYRRGRIWSAQQFSRESRATSSGKRCVFAAMQGSAKVSLFVLQSLSFPGGNATMMGLFLPNKNALVFFLVQNGGRVAIDEDPDDDQSQNDNL